MGHIEEHQNSTEKVSIFSSQNLASPSSSQANLLLEFEEQKLIGFFDKNQHR